MMKRNPPKACKINRLLITVSVQGSTGPLRFLVNDDEPVIRVIEATIKMYARQGRIPFLGSDPNRFFLYCYDGVGCQVVLGAQEAIRSSGARSFMMAKKANGADMGPESSCASATWKTRLHKSLSFKILSKLGV